MEHDKDEEKNDENKRVELSIKIRQHKDGGYQQNERYVKLNGDAPSRANFERIFHRITIKANPTLGFLCVILYVVYS
jgi:hypothetical protein